MAQWEDSGFNLQYQKEKEKEKKVGNQPYDEAHARAGRAGRWKSPGSVKAGSYLPTIQSSMRVFSSGYMKEASGNILILHTLCVTASIVLTGSFAPGRLSTCPGYKENQYLSVLCAIILDSCYPLSK